MESKNLWNQKTCGIKSITLLKQQGLTPLLLLDYAILLLQLQRFRYFLKNFLPKQHLLIIMSKSSAERTVRAGYHAGIAQSVAQLIRNQ